MATMPVTPDAFDGTCSSGDFYMAVFDENMNALEYATFFGGNQSSEHVDGGTSRFDRKGVIYQSACAGCGGFDDFPAYPSNVWSAQNNNNCNNGVYKFDFQLPLTIADFEHTPIGCTNSPIQFSSSSAYADAYSWDFGDGQTSSVTNPVHQYTSVGTYTVRLAVSSATTCNAIDTVYKTIQIQEPAVATLNNLHACSGDEMTIGLNVSDPGYQYSWSPTQYLNNPNIANPVFEAGSTTAYTLSVDKGGCVDTYYQTVDVTQLSLLIPDDTTLCDDEQLVLQAIVLPQNANIIWSDESTFGNILNDDVNDADIEVEPIVPTTYYVQITTNGCVLTDEVFVNLVSFQTVIQGDFTACVGDTVSLFVQDPNPDFVYKWLPDELVLSGQGTSHVEVVVEEPTMFTIISHTPDGCTANDSVFISVSLLNQDDVIATAEPSYIVNGQSSQLTALPQGYSYQWSPSATLNSSVVSNPVASPTSTTTYNVIIRDGECVATKSVTVYVTDFVCGRPTVYVPNSFTPNADNKNDLFYVRANQLSSLYFVIYDRWGEKVFETRNLQTGWDGTFKGRALDPDVYVYYLDITCVGGEEYQEQGNITLIR
jgi:gliding motility-associated-like protein